MLTSIIISIVLGLLCLVIAITIKKNTRVSIISGIFGVTLLFYGGYGYGSLEPVSLVETFNIGNKLDVQYPVENVQVISPIDGDKVSCRILTMGVYPDDHNKDIWVLLKPSDNKFYPQSDYTNTSYKENGKWQVVTRFGGDQDESYELYVYETNAEASGFFSKTIESWKETNDYVGLTADQIPSGAVKVDKITVSLEGNCRGIH
ncbi:MAG: hypothetical protein HRU26_10275 [Psychroserpens sp.]|nr:hypothetical protein [Psychroserpens sp.]